MSKKWKCMNCGFETEKLSDGMDALVGRYGLGRFCPSCIDEWMRHHWGDFLLIEIEEKDNETI